jgi:hypothetical protein
MIPRNGGPRNPLRHTGPTDYELRLLVTATLKNETRLAQCRR